jgi:endonuclease/exonuclease/phosphatase family metal-dependent hydrolase
MFSTWSNTMGTLRIATYNIEWMNNWFVKGKPKLRTRPGTGMGRNPKNAQLVAERVASVIRDIDAHIIGVQEGPSTLEQMQFFVDEFLDKKYKAFGFESGAQSIYGLVRKDCPVKATPYAADDVYYSRLQKPVVFQPWGEVNNKKNYKMARPPALLRLTQTGGKDPVHLIVAHTKSQFTQGFTKKAFDSREPTAMKAAILSRQKLSADVAALRRHVTNVILEKKNASAAILMGDLNDGFTRSVFEKEFLMQSLVDELRGSFRRQSALLDHVMNEAQLRDKNAFTVEFRSPEKKGITRELIDHILVTPALQEKNFWLQLKPGSAKIEHAISKAHTSGTGANADDRPSDHVPVTADFKVS